MPSIALPSPFVAAARVALLVASVATSVAASLGCTRVPEGRSAVDAVTTKGTDKVDEADVLDQIATAPTTKFLGLFRGVIYDYEVFDPYVLERDLQRIERYYHARGYYDAHARAGRFVRTSSGHVRVEIVVEEGTPILDGAVDVTGLEGLPGDVADEARHAAEHRLHGGRPFEEDAFKQAEADVKKALTDHGYAFAKVTSDAYVDVAHKVANTTFAVVPGPPATFGPIHLEGLGDSGIEEGPVLRTLDLHEGDPYSTASIDAASQALVDLGVFASVEVTPEIEDPPPPSRAVPIRVKVEPAKLRNLRLGGGLEFDQIKTDLHLLIGWEDENFLGGLRDFTVELRPGAVLYPTRLDNVVAPTRLLPEERLRLSLDQPGFIEARTHGFVRPEINVFPLLVKADPSPEDPIVGYLEPKSAIGVDRAFGKLFVSFAYNAQIEAPFTYKGDLDPALRTLVISYPELVTELDLRNDRIHPHKGIFLRNDLQVAGGPFLGDATDVKIQPEIRTYLPIRKKMTFATRASVGFMFPTSYGDVVEHHLNDPLTDANRADRVRDIETVYFRGFFSGGASQNRGFPIRGVAPHGVVPFLNPATAAQQVALACDPSPANNFSPDPSLCSIPIGGFTLWELSNELRLAIAGPFSAAGFCDMSDVSARTANVRLDHLHLSCGAGVRYDTPVGPIRLEVGYRIQPLQVLGYPNEDAAARADPSEGFQPKLFGVPLAIAVGIGEAF